MRLFSWFPFLSLLPSSVSVFVISVSVSLSLTCFLFDNSMLWFSGINIVDSNLVSRCRNVEFILKDAFLSISIHLNALPHPRQTLTIARIWRDAGLKILSLHLW